MAAKQKTAPVTPTRTPRPTIATIAAHMGLSRATVTHVLNGRAAEQRIRPETQRRVLEVARELGYRANASARAIRAGRFGNIALTRRVSTSTSSRLPRCVLCSFRSRFGFKRRAGSCPAGTWTRQVPVTRRATRMPRTSPGSTCSSSASRRRRSSAGMIGWTTKCWGLPAAWDCRTGAAFAQRLRRSALPPDQPARARLRGRVPGRAGGNGDPPSRRSDTEQMRRSGAPSAVPASLSRGTTLAGPPEATGGKLLRSCPLCRRWFSSMPRRLGQSHRGI
jgi:hypothetical protein